MRKRYRIAIYIRLSKEDDEGQDESNSITSQRALLRKYVGKNFIQYELIEFVDDGYSGTNFRRPGITNLLNQAREGEIDCVIVKDFSRFSRDYIELGSYLDQIFPFLGVRFISVNDNYDSAVNTGNTIGLDTSFKGLMYDLYSKDLSVKVKSSLQTRKGQGQYACGNAPFGYQKDPKDRHQLVIAEDEANIVRRIFTLTMEGKTSPEIAKLFNQEGVPTPIEFKIRKKQTSRKPLGDKFRWNHSTICGILKNPAYAGDMVYDKYDKNEVGGKNHLRPRSQWKIYRNHHAAIISRDIFDQIQKKRNGTIIRNPDEKKQRHPLQGKVFCGGCKGALILRKGNLNPYFTCKRRYDDPDMKNCVCNVNLMFLEQVVLCRIDSELYRQEKLKQIKMQKEAEIRERIEKLAKNKDLLVHQKAVLERERLEDYEKSVFDAGHKFRTDHRAIEQVEKLINEVEQEIIGLEGELSRGKDRFAELFSKGCQATLTRELVDKLIDKINVYDEQRIEIRWSFGEEFAVF